MRVGAGPRSGSAADGAVTRAVAGGRAVAARRYGYGRFGAGGAAKAPCGLCVAGGAMRGGGRAHATAAAVCSGRRTGGSRRAVAWTVTCDMCDAHQPSINIATSPHLPAAACDRECSLLCWCTHDTRQGPPELQNCNVLHESFNEGRDGFHCRRNQMKCGCVTRRPWPVHTCACAARSLPPPSALVGARLESSRCGVIDDWRSDFQRVTSRCLRTRGCSGRRGRAISNASACSTSC